MNPNDFDIFAIHERAEKNISDVDNFIASLKPREYIGRPMPRHFRHDPTYCDYVKKQREEDPEYDTEYLDLRFKRYSVESFVKADREYHKEMAAQRRAEATRQEALDANRGKENEGPAKT